MNDQNAFTHDIFEGPDRNESVLVFTHRSTELLTKLNGSTSWYLNPERAKNCDYVICVRNKSRLSTDDIDHKTAFLVGKVSNVVQSLNLPRDEHRYMIEFREYAEILIPDVWKKWRSPVIYQNTQELEESLNLKFKELNWLTVPPRDHEYIKAYFEHENSFYESQEKVSNKFRAKKGVRSKDGLSIAEAKSQLSKFYDIEEDNIEIILKG